jgi:4-hydroxy-2-oxoheptanedioate aldolase
VTRFGAWSQLPNAEAVEALARSGADFVGIDAQHGAHGFRDVVNAIRLLDVLSVEALVRVSDLELELISRFLDFGAAGVIVAMVDDAETARRAVALARYQPEGVRSYGGRRFGLSPEPDELRNVRPAVYVMVETAAALANLEEIAAVPGLSGFFVGPVDLALALGGDGLHVRRLSEALAGVGEELPATAAELADAVGAAFARVVEVAHAAGIEAGTFAIGGRDAAHWAVAGFNRVVVGSDIALLRSALEFEFRAARASEPR